MTWLFVIAILLSLPSLVVFIIGGNTDLDGLKLAAKEKPTALFGMSSLGHLGEGSDICGHKPHGDSVNLVCEAGEIGYVRVSYSHYDNQGSCGCPAIQQVDADSGTCPPNTFLGKDPVMQLPCCGPRRDPKEEQGRRMELDFDNVQIHTNAGCSNDHVEAIVRGKCLGETSCSIDLSDQEVHQWRPKRDYDTPCLDGTFTGTCNGTLAGSDPSSHYHSCPHRHTRGLIVYARCFTTKIALTENWSFKIIDWHYIRRQSFLNAIVALDILTCVLFLLIIRWMKKKESEEAEKVKSDGTSY